MKTTDKETIEDCLNAPNPYLLKPKLCPLINKTCLGNFCMLWDLTLKNCGLIVDFESPINELTLQIAGSLNKLNGLLDSLISEVKIVFIGEK